MPRIKIIKEAWNCNRCGYIWNSKQRDEKGKELKPFVCPKCNSARWDEPPEYDKKLKKKIKRIKEEIK